MATDTTFKRVPLGGGGYVCADRISADGLTRTIKTDVSPGGYVWKNPNDLDATDATGTNPAFQWVPFFNEVSMVSENTSATGKLVLGNWGNGFGCHDILHAPSNPAVIYMLAPGLRGASADVNSYVFRSTDRGKTVTRRGFAGLGLGPADDSWRMWGPKSGVDPTNADHLIWTIPFGTDAGKLRRSTDGSATSAIISTFPASTTIPAATAFEWDPVNPGVAYAFRYGVALYKTTDYCANWSQVTGGPTTCRRMHVDKFGQVWVGAANAVGGLWRLDGTTWFNCPTPGGFALDQPATNPLSASKAANQVSACTDAGAVSHSYDNGATWTGVFGSSPTRVATDYPWLVDTDERYMTSGGLVYDTQVVSGFSRGRLWLYEGIGVWYTHPLTNSAQPTWTELIRGNDELIPECVIKPPGASRPCYMGGHDRAWFALNGNTSPTAQLIGRTGPNSLRHCYAYNGGDYAGQAPNQAAFAAQYPLGVFYNTDGGAGGYATVTECAAPFSSGDQTPHVAVSASGIANIVVVSVNNGVAKYTMNSGSSWATSVFSGGTPTSGYVISDKVTPGVFRYIDNTNGIWESTDGGANFSKIRAAISDQQYGKIKVRPDSSNELWWFWRWSNTGGATLASGSLHPYGNNGAGIIRRSTDSGANWTNMGGAGWLEIHDMGFGKAAPGQSFPALYATGARTGQTPGVYRSIDMASTWERLDGPYSETQVGMYDAMRLVTGDMGVYGDVWIGTAAMGLIKGSVAGAGGATFVPFTFN